MSTEHLLIPNTPKVPSLVARKTTTGPTIKQQISLHLDEYRALISSLAVLQVSAGRSVSISLAVRLALSMLADRCAQAATDPALRSGLLAALLAVREGTVRFDSERGAARALDALKIAPSPQVSNGKP